MALLETAADRRETILRQIYEVNRQTIEERQARAIRRRSWCRSRGSTTRARRRTSSIGCRLAGVEVYRAERPFEAERQELRGRHLRDPDDAGVRALREGLLENADLSRSAARPERAARAAVRRDRVVARHAARRRHRLRATRRCRQPASDARRAAEVAGRGRPAAARGSRSTTTAPDTAIAINRLLKGGARVASTASAASPVTAHAAGEQMDGMAQEFGLTVGGRTDRRRTNPERRAAAGHDAAADASAFYAPVSPSGNMDEGWTRWVLEQYEFTPDDDPQRRRPRGKLRQQFDAIIIADQTAARHRRRLRRAETIRPEYRGGIGERGVEQLISSSSRDGGTLITMGNACDLAIERLPIPVRNLKRGADPRPAFRARRRSCGSRSTRSIRSATALAPRHLRLLHQQPVLHHRRGVHVAARRPSSRATRTRTWSPRAGCRARN